MTSCINRILASFTSALALIGCLATTALVTEDARASDADKTRVQHLVIEEAVRNGTVPPALALAVAKVESGFQAHVESHAGARGVMQIMPATAQGEFGVGPDALWDARTNIRLGVTYLEQLYHQYNKRWDAALSHYNGGTLKNGRPHSYTRHYVSNVLAWAQRYELDQTVLAMTRQVAPVKVADARTPAPVTTVDTAPAPYWIFEEPGVVLGWRDYLNTADRWLTDPKGASLERMSHEEMIFDGNNQSQQSPDYPDVWDASGDWIPADRGARPSDRLHQNLTNFRRGILAKINGGIGRVASLNGVPVARPQLRFQ
jgi:hypothetical protein